MDKNGILNEKELMAFVNHFSIEPFSNIHRYVILSLALCKDEPKKRVFNLNICRWRVATLIEFLHSNIPFIYVIIK